MSLFRHITGRQAAAMAFGGIAAVMTSFITTHAMKAKPPSDLVGPDGKLLKGPFAGRVIGIAFAVAILVSLISYIVMAKFAK